MDTANERITYYISLITNITLLYFTYRLLYEKTEDRNLNEKSYKRIERKCYMLPKR